MSCDKRNSSIYKSILPRTLPASGVTASTPTSIYINPLLTFPHHNQGTMSTLRGTVYDLQSKKYISIVQLLRAVGLEEVIKLPKIAVIGNQSAGKSSLLEAISQVKLPRAARTCTRCPMEVVLRRGDLDNPQWSCMVSLRFENTKRETIEFGKTTSRDDVALLLRRAQLAILNPNATLAELQTLTEIQRKDYANEVKFSKDLIVLQITGAEVDVTFVDLPGIIARVLKSVTLRC